MNVVDVLVAEFRESIRPAIPQIIALFSDSEWGVRVAGARALSKLSEYGNISSFFDLNVVDVLVAEFREAIRHHIPQIIALLSHGEWDVRGVGAGALSKLSEQGNVTSF